MNDLRSVAGPSSQRARITRRPLWRFTFSGIARGARSRSEGPRERSAYLGTSSIALASFSSRAPRTDHARRKRAPSNDTLCDSGPSSHGRDRSRIGPLLIPVFRSGDLSEFVCAAPLLTIYGSYRVGESARLVAFDATTISSQWVTNVGL